MADFYGNTAHFRAYIDSRNYDIPNTTTDPDIEAALLVASEWLDNTYRSYFRSLKTGGRAQIREWPRIGIVDMYGYPIGNNEIPREIIQATYELTIRQIKIPGSLTVDYTPGKYSQVAVSGAVSVTYASFNSAYDVQTQMPIIDSILAALLFDDGQKLSGLSGDAVRV